MKESIQRKFILLSIESQTDFSSLNDDCIFHIFDRLLLDDVCTVSYTNKRFRNLAIDHFHRKFPEKIMTEMSIEMKANGYIILSPNPSYIKCFRKYIRNLKILLAHRNEIDISPLIHFILTECNTNLKRIRLNCNNLPDTLGKRIRDSLKSVEIVKFSYCSGSSSYYENFLKYCPNLKRLITYGCSNDDNMNGLLLRSYPKLKYFYHGYENDFRAEQLKTFLQQNENIKFLAWWLNNESRGVNGLKCIEHISSNGVHLDALFVSFVDCSHFAMICSKLKTLCDRDKFSRLEIQFIGPLGTTILTDHVIELASLKKFTTIHLSALSFKNVIPTLRSLTYLKKMYLNSVYDCVDLSATDLVEVQELYLASMKESVSKFIQQFIRHLPKLTKIFIAKSLSLVEQYVIDVPMLNSEREQLPNACELTIFTNYSRNFTNLSCNLVKLKQVKFERSCNMNDESPFVRYCMV